MKTYAHRAPAVLVSLTLLVAAALNLPAQITAANDPANLAGERVSPQDPADTLPINHGAPALEQLLRKLRTRASFMLIVAHPDDEDNGGLTYLSRGKGARVATLTLNRGEGGQNLMSADFEDALGLIRTQELLAADRYMGVDQFFGTEVDFGFSKTKEEAFGKWTHERVLYDAVRAIRLYRPLVIASVFIGEPSDGHGQHQVSGEIAQEAFKAAGDPSVFPDQIAAGLQPWQPLKVYARSPFGRIDAQGMYDYATAQYVPAQFTNYVTGNVTSTVPKANVVIPEGDTDPLLGGKSYAQFGREGRSLQKSQIGGGGGGGRGGPGGRVDVSYHRYGSKLNQPDGDDAGVESGFFDGIDTTLPGIATLAPEVAGKFHPLLEKIDQQVAEAQRIFDPAHPELTAPPLRIALGGLDEFIHELQDAKVNDLPPTETFNLLHELRIKRVQLNNALILALGLTLDATAPSSDITVGSTTAVTTKLSQSAAGPTDVVVEGSGLHSAASGMGEGPAAPTERLAPGKPLERTWQVKPELLQTITRPYFFRTDIEQPVYQVRESSLRNAPATPPALVANAFAKYQGVTLELQSIVHSGPQPVCIVPPLAIFLMRGYKTADAWILPNDRKLLSVSLMKFPVDQRTKSEAVIVPAAWHSSIALSDTAAPGEIKFQITAPVTGRSRITIHGHAELPSGAVAEESYRAVGYPGLVRTNYYTPATARIVPVDVTTAPGLNIAYLPGTGDDVPAALEDLGVHVHTLAAADLTVEALKSYDAVILGVRAYDHANLAAANPALNAYAAGGGVVIAQYNTGRLPENTGPYPLSLGGAEKVVEEDAPVKLVAADNPLLTWPNKITTADFDGWVEERGHSFMESWDPHYTALLETHDHGQQPQLGGLLVARTGKGAWIYLGLALYRQLPEGVPGSYRLLANLISAAKNPGLKK